MEGGVLVEVDATVGELAEGSLLLDLGGLNGVLYGEGMSACSSNFFHVCIRGTTEVDGRSWKGYRRYARIRQP